MKYTYLRFRLLLFGLGMVLLACLGTGLLYGIWQGRGGDWLVIMMHDLLGLSWSKAHSIYQSVFRNHSTAIFFLSTGGIFFLTFGLFLSWVTRCLGRLEAGLDALLAEAPGEITLPPEFTPLEGKLNTLRQTIEKRTLEAKLAEQRKNDLVMYLAHDIRTPLTSVIGYLSLLEEASDMPEPQRRKYTRITLDKALRLEGLVNEFFEITRYNLQQISLEKEPIDLYYMLVQLAEEFYPILNQKGNTLTLQAREDLTVVADPARLARVLGNILKNAAAYADPDSEILLRAWREKASIHVVIENCGPTIPPQKLTAIFDRFYRGDNARSTEKGGSGLGLAIAREIVTLHGGSIQARSEGGITAFTVTLPAAEQERSAL